MKKRFNVDGMTCAACQAHVERAVKSIDGVTVCNVNLLKNNMEVEYDDSITDEVICDAVKRAGYTAYLKSNKTPKKKDIALIKLIISIIFLILLMYFSMGVMMWGWPTFKVFDMEENPLGFSLIQLVLLIPIVIINFGYFIRGFKRLFKSPTMDSLIAIGATASIVYSLYLVIMIAIEPTDPKMLHMSLYFEAAGMVLVFVSVGKYLEGLSKKKTTKALESLFELAPKEAVVLVDGKEAIINASEVLVGQIVLVKKGSIIPIDGIVKNGSGSVNQANITGESIPVYKKNKDIVYSSTILADGYLEVEATKVGSDTTFNQILKLVDEASNSKAPISKLADRISSIFVPVIFGIAILVFIVNLLIGLYGNLDYVSNPFEMAFNYAITVIVIACPCALGLATPVAVMVGTGKGAENGLIIKNADILERTGKIDTIVFDKTGTLTVGSPSVIDSNLSNEDLCAVYSIEKMSEHPLSMAIINYAKDKCKTKKVIDFNSIDGIGVSGIINEDKYLIGNKKVLNCDISSDIDISGKTVLYVVKNEEYVGLLTVLDDIKPEAIDSIRMLKDMNIKTVMLTGDNNDTANAIAIKLGINDVISDCMPADKAKAIERLKQDGIVAMVGDGVNDAIALTTADLGIAIGGGSDVASEASDIVLVRYNLYDVVNAIRLSKRTVFTIKLGLFWAFIYNLICVVLATGLFYHITKGSFIMKPEYGSIAMSISSVSVVLNALSINLFKMKGNIKEEKKMNKIIIGVNGMMCKHCKAHVEEACMNVNGVVSAIASLDDKNVTVECDDTVTKEALVESITDAGYDCE